MAINRTASFGFGLVSLTLPICFSVILYTSQKAQAALPPVYHVGEVTLSADSEYFTSTSNYDRYGNKQSLLNDYYYKNDANSIDGKYDMESSLGVWSLGAGVGVNYADSRGIDEFTSTEKVRTNSQFTDAHIVIQKPLPFEMFRLIPEIKGSLTFNTIDQSRISPSAPNFYDDVLTSDECNTVQAGTWAEGNFNHGRIYGYVGYEYRDDGRSSLLPWTLGGLFQFHNIIAGGELDGYESITNDTYSSTYSREVLTDRVDGGSFRYYAVNPAESEVRFNAGYSFNRDISVTGGVAQTIRGQETAFGQTYFLSLAYSFDTTATGGHYNDDLLPQTEGARKAALKRPRRNGRFQPEIENYDESLFNNN